MSKETEDRIAKLRQRVREDLQEIKAISTGCGSWFEVAGESVRCGEASDLCQGCTPSRPAPVLILEDMEEPPTTEEADGSEAESQGEEEAPQESV